MKRTVRLTLNSRKFGSQTTVEGVHVGDDNSCELIITVTDGNKILDLSSETTVATMCGTKPDGTVISRRCSIIDNNIVYTLEKQDTAVSGNVLYQVTVVSDDGISQSIIATAKFTVAVMKNIYMPIYRVLESEPSDWSTNYTAYYRLLDNKYTAITDSTCPAFLNDTFYFLVNPNYDSKDDYGAFQSALARVENLIGRASDLKIGFDNINNNIDLFISKYLNSHPELTTTVQNGSITEAKFADVLKLKKASFYRNVAEMQSDTSLKSNMTAVVLGYYESNDGGAAEYYIGDSGNIALNNGLRAQIVIKPQMNVECFGAKGDGVTDDSSAIEAASAYDTHLIFGNKTYFIEKSMIITGNFIYWLGNNTVFQLSDNFQLTDRTAIKISCTTHIENISMLCKSSYEAQNNESEAVLLRITDGKHHTLKNVNIRLTQADGKSACNGAVWYDFATSREAGGVEKFEGTTDNTLTVENCKIENLTTGYETGTSCLWGTGLFSSIILNNCEFTRNFSGDAVNFWANDNLIKNININNCVFNLTNNIYGGSCGLQFGASSTHPTTYEMINISNTVFNIGAGFGNACIGCSKPGTKINVNRCKFIKDYDAIIDIPIPPDVEPEDVNSYKNYYKRLVVFNVFSSDAKASDINVKDCEIKNKKSNLWIDILSKDSYKTQFRINDTSISAFANIYNPANMYCVNCSIAIDNDDKYVFYQSNAYSINTSLQNCAVNAISKISGDVDFCNTDFSDTLEIKSSNGKNIIAENNNFKELNIVTTSESTVENPVISELIMKNNIISVLNFKNNSIVTSVDNLDTLAVSVIFTNNISNKTMLSNIIK